jgi:hypothetical protein
MCERARYMEREPTYSYEQVVTLSIGGGVGALSDAMSFIAFAAVLYCSAYLSSADSGFVLFHSA